MSRHPLDVARTVTTSTLAVSALATVALGVHLADARAQELAQAAASRQLPTTSAGQSTTTQRSTGQVGGDDGGFQQVQPVQPAQPVQQAPQSSSSGGLFGGGQANTSGS